MLNSRKSRQHSAAKNHQIELKPLSLQPVKSRMAHRTAKSAAPIYFPAMAIAALFLSGMLVPV
jgi:hypothetical protein